MQVSVIITVYNKAAYLKNTIAALANLDDAFVKEFIFVDDGSSDDSLAILNEHAAKLSHAQILANSENLGPAKSTNIGVRESTGDIIFFVDGDDMVTPNYLTSMVGLLDKNNADSIYFKHHDIDQAVTPVIERMPQELDYSIMTTPLALLENSSAGSSTFGIRRSLLQQIGDICEERAFIQDYSLCLNVFIHSKKMVMLLTPALYYISNAVNSVSTMRHQALRDKALVYYLFIKNKKLAGRKYFLCALAKEFKAHHKQCYRAGFYRQAFAFYIYRKYIRFLTTRFILSQLLKIINYCQQNYKIRYEFTPGTTP